MEHVSKQLGLAGRLKPEARLGLAISEFAQSLDENRRREFQCVRAATNGQISGRDVIKVTEEINQEGARRHRSWRAHGTKVGGFLSRIQAFASVGDVLIGGSQNLIASSVWGAVKLSLTVATSYLNYFDKLSTLFMRLGNSWSLHEDFAQLFPRSETLQTFFCEYLIVLVRLCKKIVVFEQKKPGAQLFSSLGSSFDSEFGPIRTELDQWGHLIQQQSQILATKIVTGAEKSRLHNLKQRVLRLLSPYQSEFETRWRRQRKKGTCQWIFDEQSFKDWRSTSKSSTICVAGNLGSGKTVSLANIVARTNLERPCAYVFCASQEPNSVKATAIFGTLAWSLLDHLATEDLDWKDAEQHIASISIFDCETIIDFLLPLLPRDRKYTIVADGLEDCSDTDVADVMSGLRRLMQERTVLLCYSCRSDSRFQHLAKQHLRPEFSIHNAGFRHDAELEAFIVDEVTRRNATRHLDPNLEELIMKQLIVGAQGMYLWASLQLDTIFPASSNVVVTDEYVLDILTHLPKDLPEAFERALERIVDQRYEGRIMKLLMSAVTPLHLDELRVALCVVVGELVWHPEKMAKDGLQLVSLCGGNLIELDEEDGKVRFIHHSVIQHLLSPASSQSTAPYHCTAEDSENYIGSTCVTYLHLPVLDSRITLTGNLQSQQVLDKVMGSTRQSLPGLSRLVQHIKLREEKQARTSQVDIGHILSQIQATRIQQDVDPRCFATYATSHWMVHTRFFDDKSQDCKESWKLFWRLLNGDVAVAKPPCPKIEEQPFAALLWAVDHGHGALFRSLLARGDLQRGQITHIVRELESRTNLRGKWLGDILAQYLQGADTIDASSTAQRIAFLLEIGADPMMPHSIMGLLPCDILIRRICTNCQFGEQKLIRAFFCHPALNGKLDIRSMRALFQRLLENAKLVTIAEILASHPDLKHEFCQIQAKLLLTVETAQDHANRARKAFDIQGSANARTLAGTTLLWDAIETKNDAWVYHLLRLGADPNIGPFKMRQHIDSTHFMATCYPLEAALWLCSTRVCLELLHHGADIGRLVVSPMRIAEETGNWIIISRLQETPGWTRQLEKAWSDRSGERDGTALVTACRILFQHGISEAPSSPASLDNAAGAANCTIELDQVIYQLARDASAEYVNTQDLRGRTALHYLSKSKNTDAPTVNHIVIFLLRRGADVFLADNYCNTPLWLAILTSAPIDAIINPLLRAGADPNRARVSPNFHVLRETLLMYQGQKEELIRLVKLLLQSGADPRDVTTFTSPDPALISMATYRGVPTLVDDFKEYTSVLNGHLKEARGFLIT